jgi:hypothetical protein
MDKRAPPKSRLTAEDIELLTGRLTREHPEKPGVLIIDYEATESDDGTPLKSRVFHGAVSLYPEASQQPQPVASVEQVSRDALHWLPLPEYMAARQRVLEYLAKESGCNPDCLIILPYDKDDPCIVCRRNCAKFEEYRKHLLLALAELDSERGKIDEPERHLSKSLAEFPPPPQRQQEALSRIAVEIEALNPGVTWERVARHLWSRMSPIRRSEWSETVKSENHVLFPGRSGSLFRAQDWHDVAIRLLVENQPEFAFTPPKPRAGSNMLHEGLQYYDPNYVYGVYRLFIERAEFARRVDKKTSRGSHKEAYRKTVEVFSDEEVKVLLNIESPRRVLPPEKTIRTESIRRRRDGVADGASQWGFFPSGMSGRVVNICLSHEKYIQHLKNALTLEAPRFASDSE